MYHTIHSWLKTGTYFYFGDFKIFYQSSAASSKQTIFLIHGYPTSSFDWSKIWHELSAQYQLIAIDLLGLGFSDKPTKYCYSFEDHANQCIALFKHLNLKDIHLIGHDLGVGIIQELLDRQQQKLLEVNIQSAIFMNGSLFAESYQPRLIQKIMASRLGHLITHLISSRIFARSMQQMFDPKHQPSDEDLAQWYELLNFNAGKKSLVSLNRSIFARFEHRDRLVNALIHSPIPKLLINGKNDPNSGHVMALRYQELIPQPHIIELEQCGHWTPWEQPQEVAKEIMHFLSTQPHSPDLDQT